MSVVFSGKDYVPSSPFDYHHVRAHGSHLLRCCAVCGGELEFYGETLDEAAERERREDAWESYPDPPDRGGRLDYDDHDICQCEGRNR